MADEKKKGRLGSLIIMIVVPAAVAFGVTFAVLQLLGNNVQSTQESQPVVQNEIKAILIQPGTYQTFMLKGGKDVAVIDSLSFKVASDSCRAAIAEKNDEIMDGLMLIFLSKERSELNTASGIELLKKQIRAMVNEITGFTGDREKYGVIGVFLYIKAISAVE
ncbi:MAG: flagellar basal body-associated FliL family protein [Thermotogaceae bacterium]|nr:flagellar basal body-associated FliL family protein [Thermotogaceae bacterium]